MRSGAAALLFVVACSRTPPAPRRNEAPAASSTATTTLIEARRTFVTKVTDDMPKGSPAPTPPAGVLDLIRYPSAVGPLAAYVSPRVKDGKRRPAIVWIVGGFDNAIDDSAWEPAPRDNDQSARAFREAGIILMLPSLRGGNDNPGKREAL